ncbi:MAG: lipid-A-disaccharide synthase N-terminal domain-containing protein [Planctomycetes bacterium]|nr:lipid-A-disaccharide synthase N-terminal domain-containing protein [Planctomycetota bacterium]
MPANEAGSILNIWITIGFAGQIIFFSRLLIQWFLSERAGKPVIPIIYWYLSLIGNTIVLVYAIKIADPVFILSHAVGECIYIRQLILHNRSRAAEAGPREICPHCGQMMAATTLITGTDVP